MKHIILSISCMIILGTGLNAAVRFTQPPTLLESAGKAAIRFTVSEATDVEVAVLDASGKVVRHLAQGVLGGEKAPPLPLDSGLSQELMWDGLDDYGKPVYSHPFKVRVRLGVTPEFEKRIHIKDASIVPASWITSAGMQPNAQGGGFGWGPDTLLDTTDLIPVNHPIWFTGKVGGRYSAKNPDSTPKVAFYDGNVTLTDMTVSDLTDEIVIHLGSIVVYSLWGNAWPQIFSFSGSTGRLLKAWARPTVINPINTTVGYSRMVQGEPAFDWSGRTVLHGSQGWGQDVFRYDINGAPRVLTSGPNAGCNVINRPRAVNGVRIKGRGITTGPDGSIYDIRGAYQLPNYPDTTVKSRAEFPLSVVRQDSLGNMIKDSLINSVVNLQGIKVDLHGNIFLGVRLKPYPDTIPKDIRGKVKGSFLDRYSQFDWAGQTYSSIVKFGPEGGKIINNTTGPYFDVEFMPTAAITDPLAVQFSRMSIVGAGWVHYGSSFIMDYNTLSQCYCFNPRFDVDRFGRVLYPNPFGNEFAALDNNGNPIFRVHNKDLFTRNQFRVGLVTGVEATDRGVYLSDHTNNQIIVMTWKAEVETLLTISSAMVEGVAEGASTVELSNAPNPFNPSTRIRLGALSLMQRKTAILYVYDAAGRMVSDLTVQVRNGANFVEWNGLALPSGLYYCKLTVASRSHVRTLMLIK